MLVKFRHHLLDDCKRHIGHPDWLVGLQFLLRFAIVDYIVLRNSAYTDGTFKGAFTGGIVAAFVLIAGALTFRSAKGKWKHKQSMAIIPPVPEPHTAQRTDTV